MERIRKFGTYNDRLTLLKYVRVKCFAKEPITDSYLKKNFNTCNAIQRLIKTKVINSTSTKNVYYWNKGTAESTLPALTFETWKKFNPKSWTEKEKIPTEQEIISDYNETKIKPELINLDEALQKQLTVFMFVLDEALQMAANYGVTNYPAYIKHYIQLKYNL